MGWRELASAHTGGAPRSVDRGDGRCGLDGKHAVRIRCREKLIQRRWQARKVKEHALAATRVIPVRTVIDRTSLRNDLDLDLAVSQMLSRPARTEQPRQAGPLSSQPRPAVHNSSRSQGHARPLRPDWEAFGATPSLCRPQRPPSSITPSKTRCANGGWRPRDPSGRCGAL